MTIALAVGEFLAAENFDGARKELAKAVTDHKTAVDGAAKKLKDDENAAKTSDHISTLQDLKRRRRRASLESFFFSNFSETNKIELHDVHVRLAQVF